MIRVQIPIQIRLAFAFMGLVLATDAGQLLGQENRDLLRREYYIARDLYDAGNIGEATERFRVAINRSQQVNQQRWIDSVPALVMLGECYYQQGALSQSLDQYDAALMISRAFPTWADDMRSVEPLTEQVSESRGIQWAKLTRRVPLVRVPNSLQIATPKGAPALWVDASEILRCFGIALNRRQQLLGPLAKYSPLSAPMVEHFTRAPSGSGPWMTSAWRALHGLAILSLGDEAQAKILLNGGSSIDNQADFFMTPQCLIALAQLDVRQGNIAGAFNRLSDASIRSAQLEQADALAESLALIGQLASANRRVEMLPALQEATAWCRKYSTLAFLSGGAATSELAVVAGNPQVHEGLVKEMLNLLRGSDVALPRLQSQLGYAMAKAASSQNRLGLAESQLETSLSMLRGSPSTGASVPRVFQTQLCLELVSRGNLSVVDGEQAFSSLLNEPTSFEWMVSPLDCLVSISTAHLPAYEKALELAQRRNGQAETIRCMDAAQRQRFFEVLPLGGRLLAVRQALSSERQSWSAEIAKNFEPILKTFPTATSLPTTLREQLTSLHKEPLAVDDRSFTSEAKRKLTEIGKLAEAEENLVLTIALQRIPIARHWPAPIEQPEIQSLLGQRDMVLSFVHSPTAIYATAISKKSTHVWTIAESAVIDSKIALLLTQIGIGSPPNLDVTPANLPWRTTSADLAQKLFSTEARQMLAGSERLIVIPSGNLWYLPFELLPVKGADARETILSRHAVCYLPTLSHLRFLNRPAPPVSTSIGMVGPFFSTDRTTNSNLAGQVGKGSAGKTTVLELSQKSSLSSPSVLRLQADQIWVASELPMAKTAWEVRVLPIEPNQENALANWMQTPLKAPGRLFLPGLQSSLHKAELKGGNELFVPACTLMAAGTRSIWLSRWKVGGRSSHFALSRLVEEMEVESPSSAWQRTAIALWAEKLAISDEPLIPNAKALPASVEGQHPLLWSGYMMIGDNTPPE